MAIFTNNLSPVQNISGDNQVLITTDYQTVGRVNIQTLAKFIKDQSAYAGFKTQTYQSVNGNTISPQLQEWSAIIPLNALNTLSFVFPQAYQGSQIRISSSQTVAQITFVAYQGDIAPATTALSVNTVLTYEYNPITKIWYLV